MPLPAFLITVDTEGDNLWAKPRAITTRNADFLPRFQALCEKYALKPTYLTNWEMANCPAFVELGRDVLARGAGEIGMHLHAWNSPPIVPLTADDDRHAPYLIEYPEPLIREKVKAVTGKLQEVFGVKMQSHRAGRWSFNETYARALVDEGYRVDCSVTPHVSWRFCKGDPNRPGGSDYTHFPDSAYFLDLADIARAGNSPLLELPLTVLPTQTYPAIVEKVRSAFAGSFYGTLILRRIFPHYQMLMPNGRNRESMLNIIASANASSRPYIELAIHSSELMPGGSPTFPDAGAVENLYADLEVIFSAARGKFAGSTLAEYRERYVHDVVPERAQGDFET